MALPPPPARVGGRGGRGGLLFDSGYGGAPRPANLRWWLSRLFGVPAIGAGPRAMQVLDGNLSTAPGFAYEREGAGLWALRPTRPEKNRDAKCGGGNLKFE